MKNFQVLLVILMVIGFISGCTSGGELIEPDEPEPIPEEEEPNPYPEIQAVLLSEPPCGGDQAVRREAILSLNEFLKDEASIWDEDLAAFYADMMEKVASEIQEPVQSGVRIWSMYNHGFIIKTPSTVFAFDLVNGYSGWDYQLPDEILKQIQVLFISHNHGDHQEYSITRGILDLGSEVVAPIENQSVAFDMIYLSPDEEVDVAGLHVNAYDGLHGNQANRIYYVTTPEGLTIMHTGDNQTSDTLPEGVTVDILLINAWVNESGSASPEIGLGNSIKKLTPKLTIPGHIQELGHAYDPASVFSRLPFEPPLAVAEMPLSGQVSVQFWGERCDFSID